MIFRQLSDGLGRPPFHLIFTPAPASILPASFLACLNSHMGIHESKATYASTSTPAAPFPPQTDPLSSSMNANSLTTSLLCLGPKEERENGHAILRKNLSMLKRGEQVADFALQVCGVD